MIGHHGEICLHKGHIVVQVNGQVDGFHSVVGRGVVTEGNGMAVGRVHGGWPPPYGGLMANEKGTVSAVPLF